MASHTVTAWQPTLVTNLSSLRLTYDCLHNRVRKQTDWHRHSSQTMSFHLSPSAHTTHTQCGLGEMLWQPLLTPHSRVFSWPTLRVTTRVHKQPSSLRQLIVYIATACQRRLTTELLQTHNTHLLPLWRDATIRSSSTIPTTASTTWPGYSPRVSQPRQHTVSIPGAVFDPGSKQSTTADNPRLPSNRREHKVFVFQAIDESTKSSSSKQSTTAQSLRLPSNRRAFLHQHTERRAATRQRQLAASTADQAGTNHTHKLSRCTLVRSQHFTHARATHSHTNTNCNKLCASVTNEFIVSAQWKQKKKNKNRNIIKNHTLTTQTQTTQNEKTYECHVCAPEKMPLCLRVQCPSF